MFDAPTRERMADDRTQMMPPAGTERPRPAQGGRRRTRSTVRRVRRTLRHIDPLSVFKLSLFFYGLGVIAWLIFVGIVYSIINSLGWFEFVEDISRGLVLDYKVEIDLFFVEKWALLIGVVFWLLGSILNALMSFLYNVGADTIGGIEMTFVERDG